MSTIVTNPNIVATYNPGWKPFNLSLSNVIVGEQGIFVLTNNSGTQFISTGPSTPHLTKSLYLGSKVQDRSKKKVKKKVGNYTTIQVALDEANFPNLIIGPFQDGLDIHLPASQVLPPASTELIGEITITKDEARILESAVSTDYTRQLLNYAWWDSANRVLVSCDTHRLVVIGRDYFAKEEMAEPVANLVPTKIFAGGGTFSIYKVDDEKWSGVFGNTIVYNHATQQVSFALQEPLGHFPNWQRVIPHKDSILDDGVAIPKQPIVRGHKVVVQCRAGLSIGGFHAGADWSPLPMKIARLAPRSGFQQSGSDGTFFKLEGHYVADLLGEGGARLYHVGSSSCSVLAEPLTKAGTPINGFVVLMPMAIEGHSSEAARQSMMKVTEVVA